MRSATEIPRKKWCGGWDSEAGLLEKQEEEIGKKPFQKEKDV